MRLLLFIFFFSFKYAYAFESLSYSGRLVNTNGSPVTGYAKLTFELAYSNNPGSILCTELMENVSLANGVFHVVLEFPGCNLNQVIKNTPAGQTVGIRVIDRSQSPERIYSFQAIHSLPYAMVSKTAKQLDQLGATNGQVLSWEDGQWKPKTLNTSAGAGTVTEEMLQGNIPRSKLATGNANEVVVNDASGNLTSLDANAARAFLGAMAVTDVPMCPFNKKLQMVGGIWVCEDDLTLDGTKLPLSGGTLSGPLILSGDPGSLLEATTKEYVDSTVDAIDPEKTGAVKFKANGFQVELKANSATEEDLQFVLPKAKGTAGEALVTDGNGNLSWAAPAAADSSNVGGDLTGTVALATIKTGAVTSDKILDGTITNTDIAALADIDQSKIKDLALSLSNKENKLPSGNAGEYWDGSRNWVTLDTSKVSESGNLYFTDERARDTLSVTPPLVYDNTTGVMSFLAPGTSGNLLRSNGTTWESWVPNYLSSEADTLQTITDRGDLTTTFSKFSGGASFSKIGVGTDTPVGVLDIRSTTSGILIPRMTGAERDLIATPTGMQIYNTTTNKINFHDGSSWKELGVSGSGVQSITTGTGLISGTITETGTINVDVGTNAGQIPRLNVAGKLESSVETDPTVSNFAKSALPNCGVGQVLKSDGTAFSCVADANTVLVSDDLSLETSGSTIRVKAEGILDTHLSGISSFCGIGQTLVTNGTGSFYCADRYWELNADNIFSLDAVAIGGNTASSSAILDLQSTTKGFLPPRMTTAQREAIASPVNGLIVYDTDEEALLYFSGGQWKSSGSVSASSAPSLSLNFSPAPVTYMKFDNSMNDETTTYTATGTNTGYGKGLFGQSLFFNGTNSHVKLDDNLQLLTGGDFTASIWVRINNNSGSHNIFNFRNLSFGNETTDRKAGFLLVQNGLWKAVYKGASNAAQIEKAADFGPAVGEWSHVTMRKSGNNFNVFVNGILVPALTATTSGSTQLTSNIMALGRHHYSGDTNAFLNGELDDFAMWDSALTDAKIKSIYQMGSSVTSGGSAIIANDSITLDHVDFAGPEGISVPQLASNPATGSAGQIYYNTASKNFMFHDGTDWKPIASGSASSSSNMNNIEYTTKFSTTSTGWVDVPGFSVSITPSSSTSKVLVMASVTAGMSGAQSGYYRVLRNGTPIAVPSDVAGYTSVSSASFYGGSADGNNNETSTVNFVDTPGTTGTVTYKIQAISPQGGTLVINGLGSDISGQVYSTRTRSSLIVLENGFDGGAGAGPWNISGADINYMAGKVGIGTTTPGQKLTVAGMIETTSGGLKLPDGTIIDGAEDLGSSSTTSALVSGWPDAIVCNYTNWGKTIFYLEIAPYKNDNNLYYKARSSEGIWIIANSVTKVFSQYGSSVTDCSGKSLSTLISEGKAKYFGNDISAINSDSDNDTKIMVEKNSDEDAIRFDTAGAERMIIDNSGRVGIGTTTPGNKLEVNTGTSDHTSSQMNAFVARSTAYNDGANVTNQGVSIQTGWAGIGFNRIWNNGNYSLGKGYSSLIQQNPAAGQLEFHVFNNATSDNQPITSQNAMVIQNSTGNVGIGTASPSERLDLGGGNIKMGYQSVKQDCPNTHYCIAACPAGTQVISGGCVSTGYAHAFAGNTRSCSLGSFGSTTDNCWMCVTAGLAVSSQITTVVTCANIK